MMRRMIFLAVAAAVLVWAPAHAAEPSGKPEDATKSGDLQREAQNAPLAFPEQVISGNITDSAGEPLAGVIVKLFANGSLVKVAHSAPSGAYEMPMPLNLERDETVVLWFLSTGRPLQPQAVVLKQCSRARSQNLFSPCTLSAKMRPQMRLDIKLLTENEDLSALKGKGCL
jgi:hypothetical protein